MRWAIRMFLAGVSMLAPVCAAQYDTGASDTEIKLGNTAYHTGPLAMMYGQAKTAEGYIDKINAEGGIKGRKIIMISRDDSYDASKTVEQTRQLVENYRVLLMFASQGTPTQNAVLPYLNKHGIPQLFLLTGGGRFYDPHNAPWTMGSFPSYVSEGKLYAQYILNKYPQSRVGVLYVNSDYGLDLYNGFKNGLGDKAATIIVKAQPFKVTDTNLDLQIASLKNANIDVLLNLSVTRFTPMIMRKMSELNWKPPVTIFCFSAASRDVFKEVGLDNAKGIITMTWIKDPNDPRWKDDPDVQEYKEFFKKYYPLGNIKDSQNVWGYIAAQMMVHVLKEAGDDLTRKNIMDKATHMDLKSGDIKMLLPDIRVRTSPTRYTPITQMQLQQFDGDKWEFIDKLWDVE
jgi:ABC-type branched-subunit amino acid transport system substrate-binding protein